MVKKIAITGLCLALGSTLYAGDVSESEMFIGLEAGAATIQADRNTVLTVVSNFEGSDVEYGFRIGAQNDTWRTMFLFDYFDSAEDNQNYEKGLFSIDYFLLSLGSDALSLKPYMGANVGYMNYESDHTDPELKIGESGFVYGAQVGFTIGLMDTIDLDVMYRYSITDAAHTDHIQSAVVGINYIF